VSAPHTRMGPAAVCGVAACLSPFKRRRHRQPRRRHPRLSWGAGARATCWRSPCGPTLGRAPPLPPAHPGRCVPTCPSRRPCGACVVPGTPLRAACVPWRCCHPRPRWRPCGRSRCRCRQGRIIARLWPGRPPTCTRGRQTHRGIHRARAPRPPTRGTRPPCWLSSRGWRWTRCTPSWLTSDWPATSGPTAPPTCLPPPPVPGFTPARCLRPQPARPLPRGRWSGTQRRRP
jgi:hypothetical protein